VIISIFDAYLVPCRVIDCKARRLCTAACFQKCSSRRSILLTNALPDSRGDNWIHHTEHTSTRECSVRRQFESVAGVKRRSAPKCREITPIDHARCRVVRIARGQLQCVLHAQVDESAKWLRPIRIEQCQEKGARAHHSRGSCTLARFPIDLGTLLTSFCLYIDPLTLSLFEI
jgi:hypothetical protein